MKMNIGSLAKVMQSIKMQFEFRFIWKYISTEV